MKSNIFLGAAAVLLMALSGCSNEAPENFGVVQQDENRYLRVNLMNPLGTRASDSDFDPGTYDENYVGAIIMDFYDAAGNFVVRANPNNIEWDPGQDEYEVDVNGDYKLDNEGNKIPLKPDGNSGNVGKIGTGIVTIGLKKDQNLPTYVMCYINPVSWGTASDNKATMDDLRLEPRGDYKDGQKHFAMNNACYYGDNPVTGTTDVKISGTPIVAGKLYETEGDAKKANNGTVDIYVERYAAKVSFTVEAEGATGDFPENPELAKGIYPYKGKNGNIEYSLQFIAKGWTVNADEPQMYAVKNFSVEKGGGVPTMNEVQSYLGGWTKWNDKPLNRSYWACSPGYFSTDYPQVSDNIVDIAGKDKTGAGVAVSPFGLKYYSYNQIVGSDEQTKGIIYSEPKDGSSPTTKYVLENTVGKPAFSSVNPKAAVPSVLMVGQYDVTYDDKLVEPGTSFYIYSNQIYFKEQPKTKTDEKIGNAVLMKDKFISEQQVLFVKTMVSNPAYDESKKDEDGYNVPAQIPQYNRLTKDNAGSALNLLDVKHPDKEVRNQQNVPMRFVTLQLSGPGTILAYRPYGSGEYVDVSAENLNVVNAILWNQVGVAYSYTEGKCYFSMPIFHLGMDENTTDSSPKKTDGSLDWSKVRIGDLGLVRNHSYTLGVQAIKGLATGIDKLDYPIVPPADVDDYWISYRINILNWRIVPKQTGIIL